MKAKPHVAPPVGPHDKHQKVPILLIIAGAVGAYLVIRQHHLAAPSVPWPTAAVFGSVVLLGTAVGASVGCVSLWRRRFVRRVMSAFQELRLQNRAGTKPRLRKVRREGRDLWHLGFTMPVGIDSMTMMGIHNLLAEHLKASVRVEFDGELVWVHLGTRKLPKRVDFDRFQAAVDGGGEVPITIGASREADLVTDLADLPHLMVGGIAGGGKSVFLRQALTNLALGKDPEQLRLVLADLKGGMEFNCFRNLPHLMAPVCRDPQTFVQVMKVVHEELVRRMELFHEAGVESLHRWNEEHPDRRMPYVLVCVDELGELTAKTSSQREDGLRQLAVGALSQVARLGRAPGVHLILCTQRPDAEVIPGQIKSNMGAVLAFRAADPIQSQIMLGQGDVAAKLLPKDVPGRAIWQFTEGDQQVQVPFLEKREAERLLGQVQAPGPPKPPSAPVPGPAEQPWQPDAVPGKPFNVSRLKPGNRYELALSDGSTITGTLRRLDYPQGLGGENEDGRHTVQVTDGSAVRFLDPAEIVGVRRCTGSDDGEVA